MIILDPSPIPDEYKPLVDFAKKYDIKLEFITKEDLYFIFLGYYNTPKEKVVVKFYINECSDNDNTYEVLQFLEENNVEFAQKPIMYVKTPYDLLDKFPSLRSHVHSMIVYTQIVGEDITDVLKRVDSATSEGIKEKNKCYDDVCKQLKVLHSLGLVMAEFNAVRTSNGDYVIEDYGRCFSEAYTPFRPMEYMFRQDWNSAVDEVPSQKMDFSRLKLLCGINL